MGVFLAAQQPPRSGPASRQRWGGAAMPLCSCGSAGWERKAGPAEGQSLGRAERLGGAHGTTEAEAPAKLVGRNRHEPGV